MHWLARRARHAVRLHAQLRLGAVPWQVNGVRQSLSAEQFVGSRAAAQGTVSSWRWWPARSRRCRCNARRRERRSRARRGSTRHGGRGQLAGARAVARAGVAARRVRRAQGVRLGDAQRHGVQLPALVPTLHAWHSPHDGLLQQTPSTQVVAGQALIGRRARLTQALLVAAAVGLQVADLLAQTVSVAGAGGLARCRAVADVGRAREARRRLADAAAVAGPARDQRRLVAGHDGAAHDVLAS